MSATYGFADFEVDTERGRLTRRGYVIPIQEQPFKLLVLLLSRAGTVVTREEIQSHLWPGNTYVEFDKSLRVAVSKLREALRDDASAPVYIATLPRRGYQFIAPVTRSEPAQPVVFETSSPAPTEAVPQPNLDFPPPIAAPTWWKMPWIRLALGVGLATACIAVPVYVFRRSLPRVLAPPVGAHTVVRRTVAVIGLRNLTNSPEDRWLSTALAEMLTTELSTSDRVRVISGEEVARAGLAEPPSNSPSRDSLIAYGNKLGADMIVFGSYAVARERNATAPRIRLDLHMEVLDSDAPPVALVETGAATDLFSLVSASGSQLRQRLGIGEISAETATSVRRTLPQDPAAAQLYAEGLSRLRDFDPRGARDLLLRAASLDPSHAGTHLALADAWHALGYENEARAEASRAVKLGTGLPRQELLSMQGQLASLSADWPHAIELFRSLLTFYPDDLDYGLRLAHAQSAGSHPGDALATIDKLRKTGLPKADQARIELAEANAQLQIGNFHKMIEAADRALKIGAELDQTLVRAQALWMKASALEHLDQATEALAASSEAETLYRAAGDKLGVGIALLIHGDVLYDREQMDEARKSFLAATEAFRQLGHVRDTAIALERVGNSYYSQGNFAESLKNYKDALAGYRQINWDSGIGSVIGNIANVQAAQGDLSGALQSNRQGLDLFQKSDDQRGVASTLSNLGNIEVEQGDLVHASADFKRSEEIQRKIGYARGIAASQIGEGDVSFAANDTAAALHSYEAALQTLQGMDEPELLASAKLSVGVTLRETGQVQQAIIPLQEAAEIASKVKDHSQAAIVLSELARTRLKQGSIDAAAVASEQAMAEAKAQADPAPRLIATLNLCRVRIAQSHRQAAVDQLRTTAQEARRYGFGPLEMEAQILVAQQQNQPAERRRRLEELAREALGKGWNRLAAEARHVSS